MSEAERAAIVAKKAAEEEKKKVVVVTDKEWSAEDIALLTKAIAKFPPGTSQRWKVITEFCGMRN